MFLDMVLKRNPKLIETAFKMHKDGIIEPDTYILDMDTIYMNAKYMIDEAKKNKIKLYFMTKQFGRNPYIASELMKLGFEGAVAVDFREAEMLYKNGIKVSHIGHLVQIPTGKIKSSIEMHPEVITVYSLEKAREISDACCGLGAKQNIMLRVLGKEDTLYPGQYGGFYLERLKDDIKKISELKGINIYGLTSFPCFLYNENKKQILPTNNVNTLVEARKIIENNSDIKIKQMNMPSATCTNMIAQIAENGGTHGEPGHGLTGTTPLHAVSEQPEIPAMVYVSEISHNLGSKSYCYGGGYYRRSHVQKAIVGDSIEKSKIFMVEKPDAEGIDYHIGLLGNAKVGQTVIFSFRTQIFVTRSNVAVIKGISSGNPEIAGIYDCFGNKIR